MSKFVCCDTCFFKNICHDRFEMLLKDKNFNGNGCMQYCTDTIQENAIKLKETLLITKKALELACETYWNDCGMEDCPANMCDKFEFGYEKCKTCPNGGDMFVNNKGCCWVDYFLTKAKEIIQDGKN